MDDWVEDGVVTTQPENGNHTKEEKVKGKPVIIAESKLASAIKTTSIILKFNVEQFPIEFHPKGVQIVATNKFTPPEPINTVIKILIPNGKLDRWHCKVERLVVGVDSEKFYSALNNTVRAGSTIRIGVDSYVDTPNKMNIAIETGNSIVTKFISLVPIEKHCPNTKTEYTNHCKITASEFRTVCSELNKKKNHRLRIESIGGYIKFTVTTAGLDYESNHEFGKRHPEDDEDNRFVCTNMMVRQLSNLSKLASYNCPITIYTNPKEGVFKLKITTDVGTSKESIGKIAVYVRPAGADDERVKK